MTILSLDEIQSERWSMIKRGQLSNKFGKSNRGRTPKITKKQYKTAKQMLSTDNTIARIEVKTKLSRYQISKLTAGKYDYLFEESNTAPYIRGKHTGRMHNKEVK